MSSGSRWAHDRQDDPWLDLQRLIQAVSIDTKVEIVPHIVVRIIFLIPSRSTTPRILGSKKSSTFTSNVNATRIHVPQG